MNLGFFTMPIHPLEKDWRLSLQEDREAFVLADELGLTEAYVGEHVTDKAENITSSIAFLAWIAAATKQIKLGTGTINMPNSHPATVAATVAGWVLGMLMVPVPSLICLVAAAIQARNAMQEVMFSALSVRCSPT